MTLDGSLPQGPVFMLPELSKEEIRELRLGMEARARANGAGTKPHLLATSILQKLDEAESQPKTNGVARKVGGVDSSKYSEF